MYNRSFMNIIIILLLLTGCAPKSPAPEVLGNGVRFSLFAPSAKSVTIAGSFNQWDPEQARLTGPDRKGVWTITLPLSTGRHEYHFVINNREWVLDPAAPSIDDGLEGKNSFVIVPPKETAEQGISYIREKHPEEPSRQGGGEIRQNNM